MTNGKIEVKKIAKVFSSLNFVEDVTIYTFKTLKGYFKERGVNTTIEVYVGDVNTVREYEDKVEGIMSFLPNTVKGLDKTYDNVRIRLTLTQNKTNEIVFTMRTENKEVLSKVLGCNMVEVKKSYSTLTCELKA
jgi:desulfoferrodoxin (superoxide reductase-like protein)